MVDFHVVQTLIVDPVSAARYPVRCFELLFFLYAGLARDTKPYNQASTKRLWGFCPLHCRLFLLLPWEVSSDS